MTSTQLLQRVERIQQTCNGSMTNKNTDKDIRLDVFAALKKDIAAQLRTINQQIAAKQQCKTVNVHTIQLNSDIRQRIKEVKGSVSQLAELAGSDTAKLEVVASVHKHVQYAESFEKNPLLRTDDNTNDNTNALPLFDDADFGQIRETDTKIDRELDDISQGLLVLRDVATQMNKETIRQSEQLQRLDDKATTSTNTLQSLNTRLKSTLRSIKSGTNFIVNFVLLCILLAIGGVIVHMMT